MSNEVKYVARAPAPSNIDMVIKYEVMVHACVKYYHNGSGRREII